MNLLPDCNFLLGAGRFSFKTAVGVEVVAVVVIVEVVVVVVEVVVVVVDCLLVFEKRFVFRTCNYRRHFKELS